MLLALLLLAIVFSFCCCKPICCQNPEYAAGTEWPSSVALLAVLCAGGVVGGMVGLFLSEREPAGSLSSECQMARAMDITFLCGLVGFYISYVCITIVACVTDCQKWRSYSIPSQSMTFKQRPLWLLPAHRTFFFLFTSAVLGVYVFMVRAPMYKVSTEQRRGLWGWGEHSCPRLLCGLITTVARAEKTAAHGRQLRGAHIHFTFRGGVGGVGGGGSGWDDDDEKIKAFFLFFLGALLLCCSYLLLSDCCTQFVLHMKRPLVVVQLDSRGVHKLEASIPWTSIAWLDVHWHRSWEGCCIDEVIEEVHIWTVGAVAAQLITGQGCSAISIHKREIEGSLWQLLHALLMGDPVRDPLRGADGLVRPEVIDYQAEVTTTEGTSSVSKLSFQFRFRFHQARVPAFPIDMPPNKDTNGYLSISNLMNLMKPSGRNNTLLRLDGQTELL